MKIDGVAIAFSKGYRIVKGEVVNMKTGYIRKMRYPNPFRYLPYPRFNIRYKGKHFTIRAHHLSAYQKYGPALYERAMVIRHRDDNVENFSLDNMFLGTQSQNVKDMPNRIHNQPFRKAAKIRFNQRQYEVVEY